MDFLFAILAFAGVMAFLSTIVSVFVEGVHKAFALRRSGLEEMLRSLHSNVLVRFNPGVREADTSQFLGTESGRASRQFARTMTSNVSFGGSGRFWWLRNLPILSWFFQRRHERLSTLQFVEQLSRTDVGQSLRTFSRAQRQRALAAAAYEFERFGDSQSSYFQSRARILSVFFAVIFAFAANVDALMIFRQLLHDTGTRESVLRVIETRVGDSEQQMQATQAGAAPTGTQLAAQAGAAQGSLDEVRSWGLQLGPTAFPYCWAAPNPDATVKADPRCGEDRPTTVDVPKALNRAATSAGGWLWLFGVIAAGGLIGLGAPFWFELFRKLARVVPAAQSARAALQPDTAPQPAPSREREVARNPNAANLDALMLAFDVASGNVAASVADPSVSTSLDRSAGRRIVRGDGSVVLTGAATRHLR
jgi:hypothetical protein